MRTILIAASIYARNEELEFTTQIGHIQEILPSIIIHSQKKRALIHNVFGYEHKEFKPLSDFYTKSIYHEEGNLSVESKVSELLAVLKAEGLDLLNDAGFTFYRDKLPSNYKDDIKLLETIESLSEGFSSLSPLNQKEIDSIIKPAKGFTYLEEISELKASLNTTVLNQEHAVDEVCNALIKDNLQANKNLPKGIFFFLGAPATGKTFLAQNLQHFLKDFTASKILDMTQFTQQDSGGVLYGTAQHWGNAQPGMLSSFVKENPNSILIFDEFEKAHLSVQSNLLSILSEGYLEDACGWFRSDGKPWQKDKLDDYDDTEVITRVDFSQTILVFTSNLGKDVYEDTKLLEKFKDKPQELTEMIYESILKQTVSSKKGDRPAISPEFLSRLRQGSTALFQKLQYKDLLNIATRVFEKDIYTFSKAYGVKVSYPPELLDTLLINFAPSFDIRAIKAGISKQIIDEITRYYLEFKEPILRINIRFNIRNKNFIKILLEDKELLKTCKRKHLQLSFNKKLSYKNKTLKFELNDLKLSKLSKANDFSKDGICVEVPNINFKDIAGHGLVKEKLQEQVSLFNNYKKVQDLNINLSKGILLYGPPGTGKTMLAKALANESDLPFISTTGEKLLNPNEIEKVFELAKEYAPSIVFIDELDAFSKRENASAAMNVMVNKLLTSIDGFSTNKDEPIYIIAATNQRQKIDTALLRSGRIDLHIEVGSLDKEARRYFINKIVDNTLFDKKIDVNQLVKYSAGLNGADLEKMQRELILNALKYKKPLINTKDAIEQINTLKYGRRLDKKNLDKALEATAYHEAGHAILAKLLTPYDAIEQVTIIPRSNSLGFVSFSKEIDEYNANDKASLKNEIYVLLAGRASQEKCFKSLGIDAGASSDLKKANELIYKAITRYGMDDVLKNIHTSIFDSSSSLYTNEVIFKRQEAWIKEATKMTESLVKKHWSSIEFLAKDLLKKEVIEGNTLDYYLQEDSFSQAQVAYQASLLYDAL
ncbi:AAA family ATPase [Sulfurimonas sp. MAG313]|nr:AAA family ATPase [Sulfurimonas sp. MAG313]MDF1879873.1 AAA family ATPase [Sulfurimonas sp. MAG313]